jgi:hypothetical protein
MKVFARPSSTGSNKAEDLIFYNAANNGNAKPPTSASKKKIYWFLKTRQPKKSAHSGCSQKNSWSTDGKRREKIIRRWAKKSRKIVQRRKARQRYRR